MNPPMYRNVTNIAVGLRPSSVPGRVWPTIFHDCAYEQSVGISPSMRSKKLKSKYYVGRIYSIKRNRGFIYGDGDPKTPIPARSKL